MIYNSTDILKNCINNLRIYLEEDETFINEYFSHLKYDRDTTFIDLIYILKYLVFDYDLESEDIKGFFTEYFDTVKVNDAYYEWYINWLNSAIYITNTYDNEILKDVIITLSTN